MKTILIFAGRSKRFWPLSEKSFFPIAGRCLLTEQVSRLQEAGVKEADLLLIGGEHNIARARETFPSLKIVEQENLDLGMRGALLSALEECEDQPIFVVSANDIIEVDAYQKILSKKRSSQKGLILAQRVREYFPGGYLSVETDGKITGIIEKPTPGSEPSDLVNIVAHVHPSSRALLRALQEVKPTNDDGYEQALLSLLEKYEYHAVSYDGIWTPVKYPWHLLDVLPRFLPTQKKPVIHKTAKIHPTAVIEGPVIIGPNVRVLPYASVVGPSTIGEGTILAHQSLVRGSSIGKHCVIGFSSEVARSILADHVWTHMSYVGDSILGENVSFGGGTMTGNLRFDEKSIQSAVGGIGVDTQRNKFGVVCGDGVRTGVHVSFGPGVKIGAQSFIGAGVSVQSDVPHESFVKMGKDGIPEIRRNIQKAPSQESRGEFKRNV